MSLRKSTSHADIERYVPYPSPVEAVRFMGAQNFEDILNWLDSQHVPCLRTEATPDWVVEGGDAVLPGNPEYLHIDPLGENPLRAEVGQFIVRNPNHGTSYVIMSYEDFIDTYRLEHVVY